MLVYFAGYGTRDPAGRPALVLHDLAGDDQPALLAVEDLRALLPAEARCALIVDAGFDGQTRSLAREGATPAAAPSWPLLTATAPDAPLRVPDHLEAGLLSYHLRRGLSGAADRDGDGRLSLTELAAFCDERVVAASAFFGQAQRPLLSGDGDRFVLSLTAPAREETQK